MSGSKIIKILSGAVIVLSGVSIATSFFDFNTVLSNGSNELVINLPVGSSYTVYNAMNAGDFTYDESSDSPICVNTFYSLESIVNSGEHYLSKKEKATNKLTVYAEGVGTRLVKSGKKSIRFNSYIDYNNEKLPIKLYDLTYQEEVNLGEGFNLYSYDSYAFRINGCTVPFAKDENDFRGVYASFSKEGLDVRYDNNSYCLLHGEEGAGVMKLGSGDGNYKNYNFYLNNSSEWNVILNRCSTYIDGLFYGDKTGIPLEKLELIEEVVINTDMRFYINDSVFQTYVPNAKKFIVTSSNTSATRHVGSKIGSMSYFKDGITFRNGVPGSKSAYRVVMGEMDPHYDHTVTLDGGIIVYDQIQPSRRYIHGKNITINSINSTPDIPNGLGVVANSGAQGSRHVARPVVTAEKDCIINAETPLIMTGFDGYHVSSKRNFVNKLGFGGTASFAYDNNSTQSEVDGGQSINAKNVTLNVPQDSSLTVYGGFGSNGVDAGSQQDGRNGADGATAISCNSLKIPEHSGIVNLYCGEGGDGGKGGKGKNGSIGVFAEDGKRGGNGGMTRGPYITAYIENYGENTNLYIPGVPAGGQGGDGGDKMLGGNAGRGQPGYPGTYQPEVGELIGNKPNYINI